MRPFAEIVASLTPERREQIEARAPQLRRDMTAAPRIMLLVGPPGSGKSTWRDGYLASTTRKTTIISSDDLIEEFAAKHGISYSEAFPKLDMARLDAMLMGKLRVALANRDDVIVDRTNLRVKGRARFLSQVPKHYLRVAVVFDVPQETLLTRIRDRGAATGKHIPSSVFEDMVKSYETPSTEEFDLIEVLS